MGGAMPCCCACGADIAMPGGCTRTQQTTHMAAGCMSASKVIVHNSWNNSLGNYFWAKTKTTAAHKSISGFKLRENR